MDKKIKKSWVKALRSGKYTQGSGKLGNKESGFCCLGVMCKTMGMKMKDVSKDRHGSSEQNSEQGFSPPKYAKKAGISIDQMEFLADANDTEEWSFKKIAKYIESDEFEEIGKNV